MIPQILALLLGEFTLSIILLYILDAPWSIDTAHLAFIYTLLGFAPLTIYCKGNINAIVHALSSLTPVSDDHSNNIILYPYSPDLARLTLATLFGSIGLSIYLPLDPDTILQQWPYAPLYGAYLGFTVYIIYLVAMSLLKSVK